MKKNYTIKSAVCLFASFFMMQTLNANSTDDGYRLVWQDTFDGPELNETVWKVEIDGNGSGNNEMQYYRRENISIGEEPLSKESCLILTAKLEDFAGRKCTSGRLKTQGNMEFKYGKIEGRIKFPKTANGLWPAFWMMGGDYAAVGWPKCGEIDILEIGNTNGIKNNTQEYYFGGHFHWGEGWNGGAYPNWGKSTTNPYSLQDGDFHLFTLIWDESAIKMYLDLDKYPDNAPYLEMGISQSGGVGPGQVGRYFHKPYYVIFNMAIGGNYTGITGNNNIGKITAFFKDEDAEPKMYVDYVKVYQRGDEDEEYHGPTLTSIHPTEASGTGFNVVVTAGNAYISGPEIPRRVVVYNLIGQQITTAYNTDLIDLSSLPSDIYLLKIESQKGNVETHKLINK